MNEPRKEQVVTRRVGMFEKAEKRWQRAVLRGLVVRVRPESSAFGEMWFLGGRYDGCRILWTPPRGYFVVMDLSEDRKLFCRGTGRVLEDLERALGKWE